MMPGGRALLLDDLDALLDATLTSLGGSIEDGEDYGVPPLSVRRYYRRPVKLHRMPVVGRGLSVVALVHAPTDLGATIDDGRALLDRVGRAVNGRFPPLRQGNGLTVGLTVVAITPQPIEPREDAILASVMEARRPVGRALPLGLFRVNLGQEALAFALAEGPDGLFRDPHVLAAALSRPLGRFLAPLTDF